MQTRRCGDENFCQRCKGAREPEKSRLPVFPHSVYILQCIRANFQRDLVWTQIGFKHAASQLVRNEDSSKIFSISGVFIGKKSVWI